MLMLRTSCVGESNMCVLRNNILKDKYK